MFLMNCLFPERNMNNANQKKSVQHGRQRNYKNVTAREFWITSGDCITRI